MQADLNWCVRRRASFESLTANGERSFEDTPRASFQTIKTDNTHLEPFTIDESEEVRFEKGIIEQYEKTTDSASLFVRPHPTLHSHNLSNFISYQAILLFAVSAALAIGIRLEVKPNPDGQTTALLHAIFLALNNSAPPGEINVVLPVREDPPPEVALAIECFYGSSLFSLLAAVLAAFARECLNRYFLPSAVPGIDHNADRQQKFVALRDWRFSLLVFCPHILIRSSVFLLVCGVCQRLWVISRMAVYVIPLSAVPGLWFYLWTMFNL